MNGAVAEVIKRFFLEIVIAVSASKGDTFFGEKIE
jgi:hypothetical protein